MDSYQSILAKISVLEKKASALRDTEKKRVITEIRKLIEKHDIQAAELFSDVKPLVGRFLAGKSVAGKSVVSKSVHAPKKRFRPPKYQDPATGKTWNGLGKKPGWLVGDRDAFLIATQVEAADDTPRAKKNAPVKAKLSAAKKSVTLKATKAAKTGTKQKRRKTVRKTAAQEKDLIVGAMDALSAAE
jgi:DNA-binding protein H-NS